VKTRVSYPGQSLAEIAAASDNSTTAIVGIWRTMPPADQAALGVVLGTRSTVERTDPANFDQALAAQPAETLRALAKRRFSRAALRQQELNERDACYRALAGALPPKRAGYARQRAIQAKLEAYRTGPWRFERDRPAPADSVRR